MTGGWYWQALAVGTALACGLLIGIERGWKLKDQKPGTRVAAVAIGMVAVMVFAYSRELREEHDSTSAVAAISTIAIGFLAGNGNPALGIACAAIGVALLALRQELHGFVERMDADDVKALARYAIIAGA